MIATNNISHQAKKDCTGTFSQNFEKEPPLETLSSVLKRRSIKCNDEDKVQGIVDHYNSYFQEIQLKLYRHKYANDGAYYTSLLRAIIKKRRGEDYFKKKERWSRKTLDNLYMGALQANDQKKQRMIGGYSLEIQMADKLNSLIEDWNIHLIKSPKLRLDVEENKRNRRK
jgi:hypothetical protein